MDIDILVLVFFLVTIAVKNRKSYRINRQSVELVQNNSFICQSF